MTDKKTAAQRAEKLRALIDDYRYRTHVLDESPISEGALDSLKHELWKIEQEHPDLVTPDSPTQRVAGKPLDAFGKVPHARPMLSLEDVFSPEEFEAWIERLKRRVPGFASDLYAEIKMDGLAVSLEYESGAFVRGSTRGDGKVGEDVTMNLRTIESVPLTLRRPSDAELRGFLKAHGRGLDEAKLKKIVGRLLSGRAEIRGEVYMPKKVFDALNAELRKKGEPPIVNPRNGAAGSIRQLDPAITASRRLAFQAYDLVTHEGLATHEQGHELAKLLGFKANPLNLRCADAKAVFALYEKVGKKRESLDYWIDGLVVGVDDNALFERLGVVGKAPRGMVAFKFPAESVTTVVREVRWQTGRTGAITPVAVMDPVFVAGTTVRHATLHNMDEIERLGVRIGDTVVLEKAGDVIPKIVEALPALRTGKEKKIAAPKACPSCGAAVARREGEVAITCPNPDCPAKDLGRLLLFVSKRAFDIDGLGEKIMEQLMAEGLVTQPADLFELAPGDLESLEGFAELSAKNLVAAVAAAKKVTLARFILALGIRHVGEETAVELAQEFGSLEKLREASLEDLKAARGIGDVVAESVHAFFHDPRRRKEVDRLLASGVEIEKPKRAGAQPFKGMTFVLTGTLESLSRDEAKDKILERGGRVSSSVGKETSYVVVGEDPGSKAAKAAKLGTPVLSEKAFLAMLKP